MRLTVTDIDEQEFDLDIRFLKFKRVRKRKPVIDTVCQIICNGDSLVADAIARQSHKDKYNKITGKKIALARALQQIGFLKSIPEIKAIHNNRKSVRKLIWNLFFTTFNKRWLK